MDYAERDQRDTRILLLCLSEQGREVAQRLAQRLQKRHERVLAALAPDEQEALVRGLSAFVRAFHLSQAEQ